MNNQNILSRRVFIRRTAQAGVGLAALNFINITARRAEAEGSVWAPMGEGMVGRPGVVRDAEGKIQVYMRREDPQGSLWTTRQKGENGEGGWEDWEQYEESFLIRSPAVGLASNGDISIFFVGKDGKLRIATRRDNQWRAPYAKLNLFSGGGTIEGELNMGRLGNGDLGIVARVNGDRMWFGRLTKPETSYWIPMYNATSGGASAGVLAGNEDGSSTMFFRDKKNQLVQGTLKPTTTSWTFKNGLSDGFSGDPVVARTADDYLEVIVTQPDDKKLLRRRQTEKSQVFDGADDWKVEEGLAIRGTPSVGNQKDKRIMMVVRADDGKIYMKLQESVDAGYKDWVKIESGDVTFNEDPVVVANANGTLEVFARANDGKLYHTRQKEPNGEFATV